MPVCRHTGIKAWIKASGKRKPDGAKSQEDLDVMPREPWDGELSYEVADLATQQERG